MVTGPSISGEYALSIFCLPSFDGYVLDVPEFQEARRSIILNCCLTMDQFEGHHVRNLSAGPTDQPIITPIWVCPLFSGSRCGRAVAVAFGSTRTQRVLSRVCFETQTTRRLQIGIMRMSLSERRCILRTFDFSLRNSAMNQGGETSLRKFGSLSK